jgi:chromosome segregation ATPase
MATYEHQQAWARKAGLKQVAVFLDQKTRDRLDAMAGARDDAGKPMGKGRVIASALDSAWGAAEPILRDMEGTIESMRGSIAALEEIVQLTRDQRDDQTAEAAEAKASLRGLTAENLALKDENTQLRQQLLITPSKQLEADRKAALKEAEYWRKKFEAKDGGSQGQVI